MSRVTALQDHLTRLQSWRNKPQRDFSLHFLPDQFKRQVQRPHKQVAAVVEVWTRLVPPELLNHTRLDSLQRGVLHVAVDTSPHLYELDRLLRQGLTQQLLAAHKNPPFHRIQLRLARPN